MKLLTLSLLSCLSFSAFAINCGDTITTKMKLTEDLDCSSYTGYAALTLREDGILNGKGYRLITPNTSVGVYAEGNIIKVKNLTIEADQSAKGVEGYNVKKLILNNVIATDMNMGVDYYSEDGMSCDRLRVSNSNLSNNNYGARVNAPSCDYSPRFVNSDFSNSQITALHISAKKVRILEKQNSTFDGSAHGFNIKGSEKVVIRNIDLSESDISGTQIFIQSSGLVKIINTKLGNADEGLHIYDSVKVIIKNSEVINSNVGIKVANDWQATDLRIKRTQSVDNNIGVLVTSYGTTTFSNIDTTKSNNFEYISVQNQD